MADTVDTITAYSAKKYHVIRLTNISDGTGESAVNKLDISTLTGPNGSAPTSVTLMEASWSIQGFTSVRLFWDHGTDDEMIVMSGNGSIDYTAIGGLHDPKSSGGTGDVLLTTANTTSGNTYTITLVFKLED